ncbi:hypothetical protein PF005_g27240 [Phytophthora fragariae]|uniref:RxLR effector protein n=1 Tax=Phytophthora fragariae TaxID=53985 RepID=A0A6A3DKI1_9STRA|nr:hypothetical protein PF003_g11202 [Phytophthora fragariae]KAE8921829.1 hypothetical protein PF009_g27898 [Phytophthora fragariae]KAE8970937.1 hypothetical protein PF011_g26223 [Phytophthora fragariae]KAE9069132.1 hypothetical protein PF010_g26780 [Phytophthora fragariae]KAE9069626.1 hypothetical protein PF007_g27249 [Phytophthora fragariae]
MGCASSRTPFVLVVVFVVPLALATARRVNRHGPRQSSANDNRCISRGYNCPRQGNEVRLI